MKNIINSRIIAKKIFVVIWVFLFGFEMSTTICGIWSHISLIMSQEPCQRNIFRKCKKLLKHLRWFSDLLALIKLTLLIWCIHLQTNTLRLIKCWKTTEYAEVVSTWLSTNNIVNKSVEGLPDLTLWAVAW